MDTYPDLPNEVVDAIQRGRKIEAIKLLRKMHGMGLKEAKEAVEAWSRGHIKDEDAIVEIASASGTLFSRIVVIAIALIAGYAVYHLMN